MEITLTNDFSRSHRGTVTINGKKITISSRGGKLEASADGGLTPTEIWDAVSAYEKAKREQLHRAYKSVGDGHKYRHPDQLPKCYDFDGATIDHNIDPKRLRSQLERTFAVLARGGRHTLKSLSDSTGDPEASVSARLRDLRKPKFGEFEIKAERIGETGSWEYYLEDKK